MDQSLMDDILDMSENNGTPFMISSDDDDDTVVCHSDSRFNRRIWLRTWRRSANGNCYSEAELKRTFKNEKLVTEEKTEEFSGQSNDLDTFLRKMNDILQDKIKERKAAKTTSDSKLESKWQY